MIKPVGIDTAIHTIVKGVRKALDYGSKKPLKFLSNAKFMDTICDS